MQEAFAVRTAWQLQAPTSNLRQQIKWRVVDEKWEEVNEVETAVLFYSKIVDEDVDVDLDIEKRDDKTIFAEEIPNDWIWKNASWNDLWNFA